MIAGILIALASLAALWLFTPGLSRRIRGVADIGLAICAYMYGIADAVEDLLPHWAAGFWDMWRYARTRAKGYLAEVANG